MIIAVNSRYINGEPAGDENIMTATLIRLAERYTEHSFFFIFDRPYPKDLNLPANVEPVIMGPTTASSLRLQYWLNYKIPILLRKHKADIMVSLDGTCSLRTKKPQCIVVNNLAYLDTKTWLSRIYKKNMPAYLAKAKSIVTVSDQLRSTLSEKYKIAEGVIDVIKPGIADVFKLLDWDAKERIKEKYSDGKAYFLFSGPIKENSNLINLLKAFTFFKKRQKSNMLLLIAGKPGEAFKKEFRSYRLRDEVKLLEDLSSSELAAVTGAAYSMVYPSVNAAIALPPLQAMQCAVPVISSRTDGLVPVYGNAALYIDPLNFNDIAEKMMLVYKDETKAKELTSAGTALVRQYSLDDAVSQLMRSILKAFNG